MVIYSVTNIHVLRFHTCRPLQWLDLAQRKSKFIRKEVNLMTANQINYWKYVEEKMQNLRQVNEAIRHNKVVEAQNQYSLEEAKRHNLESELIGLEQAAAAQTSAAAAYKQAIIRGQELEQTKWVDSQVQTRQDLLAAAEVSVKEAEAERIRSQTTLYGAQTMSELNRAGLITAQTGLTQAQERREYVGMVTDTSRAVTGIVSTIAGLFGM